MAWRNGLPLTFNRILRWWVGTHYGAVTIENPLRGLFVTRVRDVVGYVSETNAEE